VIEGNEKGKVFHLRAGASIIGRAQSDIIINDPRISREHVKLEFNSDTGQLLFTDLKSLNGCQINGETSSAGVLKDGDKLQIGNTILDCQMHNTPELTEEIRKEPILKTSETPLSSEPPISDHFQEEQTPPSPVAKESVPEEFSRPEPAQKYLSKRNLTIGAAACLVALFFLTSKSPNTQVGNSPENKVEELSLAPIKQKLESGEWKSALEMALEALKKSPNNAELEELIGDIHFQQKRLEPAIQSYVSSISHQNNSKLVHFKLAKAYIQAGFMNLALEQLNTIEKLIQQSPNEKMLFIEFAGLLLEYPELNQPYERSFIIAKALQKEIAPQSSIGYRLEAETLLQQKKIKEAEALYERALAIAPNDQQVLEQLAMTKLSLQDIPGAKLVTETWLKLNPNEVRALLAVSYLNFYEKEYLAAIPKLQNVINLLAKTPENPKRVEALHLLGLVYWEQGQKTEAETYFSESCKLGFEESCKHPSMLVKEQPAQGQPDPP